MPEPGESSEGALIEDGTTIYSGNVLDHDHDHDHEAPLPLEDNPIWQQDNVTLHSVGMDIGSSGTQVLFSRLHLRRIGEDLSSRYIVIRRDLLYQSPVALTPYSDGQEIDAEELGSIIDEAYRDARISPDQVDTGVVILTGEALRRSNAHRIAAILAERGGELVTATAGHNMEARLAAFGSGAARRSYELGMRILNIDIGGGTTKLAIVEDGQVVRTAAIHLGGRLLVVDELGVIQRLEPAGKLHARTAGFEWSLGDQVTSGELDVVAERMAVTLLDAVFNRPMDPARENLYLTQPIEDLGSLDGVLFSGGVAEYVYGQEERDFGDLGRRLGTAISRLVSSGALPSVMLSMGERIRATALGASEYSVQLSGNTGFISDPEALLPRRNLQVIRPTLDLDGEIDPRHIATAIRTHLADFDLEHERADVALALAWTGLPEYGRIAALAEGLCLGLNNRMAGSSSVYLMLDGDIALTLGTMLRAEFGVRSPILVIDGLRLGDFDYIDIGRLRYPSNTVPVTVKSLVFHDQPDHRVSIVDD
jgi:ethanolamine utilization protein EutA